jgi:site-specific DNA recombinase
MIRTFAVAQGGQIDAALIFADNGISGPTLARPQLEVLRDKAAAGEIEQILILNPDR